MKHIILFLFICNPVLLPAQVTSHGSVTSMTLYTSDPEFRDAHQSPLPVVSIPVRGQMITLKCADGRTTQAYEVQPSKRNGNYIFMIHEWWGLNDHIRLQAEKLSEDVNATVIALDLFDGKVTTSPELAAKYTEGVQDERARAIIGAAIEYAGKAGYIQTIGWCFGGGWAMQAALMAGPNATGCVMYYGMPETDQAKLAKLKCPVFGVFASRDKWINAEVVSRFESDMKKLGKNLEIHRYDADHAFANPSNPRFNKAATEDAWNKATLFLKSHF